MVYILTVTHMTVYILTVTVMVYILTLTSIGENDLYVYKHRYYCRGARAYVYSIVYVFV